MVNLRVVLPGQIDPVCFDCSFSPSFPPSFTQKKEMSLLLALKHSIIFDLLKNHKFLCQLKLVVLVESKNMQCQVYVAVFVNPTQRNHVPVTM